MQRGSATRRRRKEDGAATAGGSGGSPWGAQMGSQNARKSAPKRAKVLPIWRESVVRKVSQEGVRKTISLLLSLFAAFGLKSRNGAKVLPNFAQIAPQMAQKCVPKTAPSGPPVVQKGVRQVASAGPWLSCRSCVPLCVRREATRDPKAFRPNEDQLINDAYCIEIQLKIQA